MWKEEQIRARSIEFRFFRVRRLADSVAIQLPGLKWSKCQLSFIPGFVDTHHVCSCFLHCLLYLWLPKAFAQWQQVQLAKHASIACQGLTAAVAPQLPPASSQHSRQSLWILRYSFFLFCLWFLCLGSQCSCLLQWASSQPDTGRYCFFCLSFPTVHHPAPQATHTTPYQPTENQSGALQKKGRRMGCASPLPSLLFANS